MSMGDCGFIASASGEPFPYRMIRDSLRSFDIHPLIVTFIRLPSTIGKNFIIFLAIAETLRKYPPIGSIWRVTSKEYYVPNSTYIIEKGIPIALPIFAIHHDPQYYSKPEEFDPGRFTREVFDEAANITFMPFGRRDPICIEMHFALMQIKLMLVLRFGKISQETFKMHKKFLLRHIMGIPECDDREKSFGELISKQINKGRGDKCYQRLIRITEGLNGQRPKEKIDMDKLAKGAFGLFIAGIEASVATMAFCMYELAKSQDIQNKLRREIRHILTKHTHHITYETLAHMKFMDAVIFGVRPRKDVARI
uniref:Uncharacterized protein n=1 Tax=Phlebotomus papatasi TaxID=29031 RepID=A0A1B0GPA0_PHLPP